MPDSTRGLLIKRTESTLLHLENSIDGLQLLFDTYYPNYVDKYTPLISVITALEQVVELLRNFREEM